MIAENREMRQKAIDESHKYYGMQDMIYNEIQYKRDHPDPHNYDRNFTGYRFPPEFRQHNPMHPMNQRNSGIEEDRSSFSKANGKSNSRSEHKTKSRSRSKAGTYTKN